MRYPQPTKVGVRPTLCGSDTESQAQITAGFHTNLGSGQL